MPNWTAESSKKLVILSFASRYGSSFRLTEEAGVGSEHADGRRYGGKIASRGCRAGALSLALGWLARPDKRPAGVHVLPVKVAHLGRLRTVPIEVDGDAAGVSPVEVLAEGPASG